MESEAEVGPYEAYKKLGFSNHSRLRKCFARDRDVVVRGAASLGATSGKASAQKFSCGA
jgi:hypothetical protein